MPASVLHKKQEKESGGTLFAQAPFLEEMQSELKGRVDTWRPEFLGYYFTARHSVKHSAVLGRFGFGNFLQIEKNHD